MARIYRLPVTAVATPVTLDSIDANFPRNTVSIAFFSDAAGTTPVTSGVTGTFDVQGVAPGNQTLTDFNNSPVDASVAGAFASAGSPLESVTVTPNAIAGAAYYQVTLTGNKS